MTIIEQICAEIERLKAKYRHNGLWTSSFQSDLAGAKLEAMNELLSFLDTLQEQQKDVDLCEEIDRFYRTDEYKLAETLGRGFDVFAKHFYELGKAEQKPAVEDVLEDVKKNWRKYFKPQDVTDIYNEGRKDGFKEGVESVKPAEKQDYSSLTDLERAIHRGFLCAGVENVLVAIIKETAQDCLAQIKPKQEWNEEDERMFNQVISILKEKSRYHTESGFVNGDQIEWMEKRFKLLNPKNVIVQNWNEEDEQMVNNIIDYFLGKQKFSYKDRDDVIDWLKSLRSHWKPSEEQMNYLKKAILYCIQDGNEKTANVIKELYEQLKKL